METVRVSQKYLKRFEPLPCTPIVQQLLTQSTVHSQSQSGFARTFPNGSLFKNGATSSLVNWIKRLRIQIILCIFQKKDDTLSSKGSSQNLSQRLVNAYNPGAFFIPSSTGNSTPEETETNIIKALNPSGFFIPKKKPMTQNTKSTENKNKQFPMPKLETKGGKVTKPKLQLRKQSKPGPIAKVSKENERPKNHLGSFGFTNHKKV